jgi:probable phosphoglycerate mutase
MYTHPLSIIFARHTRTDDNDQQIYSAQNDVPLNSTGLAQALALAEKFAGREIAAIYTSDLRRARTVAELIGIRHPNIPLFPDRRLRELHMGRLAGMTRAAVLEQFPEAHFRTTDHSYDFSSVGGECRSGVIFRQIKLLREIEGRYGIGKPTTVVLVGHGTALRDLFATVPGPRLELHEQGGYTEWNFSLPSDR